MEKFNLAAFSLVAGKVQDAAAIVTDEAKKRNARISTLNNELDYTNKVLIPEKAGEIKKLTDLLGSIDHSINSMKAASVKGPEYDNMLAVRKQGVLGLTALSKELQDLRYKAASMAKEKSELTKIARGITTNKEESNTRTVYTDGFIATLELVVNK